MVLTYPDYFEEFTCLAGSCPDSCCQEWEVDVDGTAAASYLALSGDLGDALRRVLRQEDGSWRMTIENRRCPMWRADGLCRIQAELGHDALCKTCREFPRLTHEYGPVTERGLELSCPEAARLIFRGPHKLCRQETSGGEEAWDPEALDILLQSRDRILDFLNTTPLPLPHALTVLLLYAHKTQAWLDGENMPEFDPEGYLTFAEGFVQDPELKPRGVEHRQPHSGSFVCIFPYPSRLAPASLRRLRKNPKQNFSLWSAAQFSESRFSARQEKSRREYPLVFSRDFPQYWRKAASENLSGFDSPRL
ncbi:MAG: hypothetical protein E7437_03685, partial [Ruminococcaceae bacterium]|nr:hypothetical protein [Oscillospiraceae bacterium]